ncbi:hypothetical protein BRYFOR_06335 [Marvinbryantia formatexigens DSM 14469]|uniref:Uncharacterized protein n=1 Tax=Marvinbryantia formatexigens DSM 14469 TaxID=478749 RepID=C6LCI9_9FIRM|nr:hypothetical protein BRYFOR_06335 [Marvinbryantia formatexigens DSM 14469]
MPLINLSFFSSCFRPLPPRWQDAVFHSVSVPGRQKRRYYFFCCR